MDAPYKEESRSLPTGAVTFLLTDIEGSTKRWEKHPRLMKDVVERHDEILVRIVEENDGVDLRKKGEGDSHFAVFSCPTNAITAAMQMQRALMAQDWRDVGPIKIRIAIHTGEAEIRDDDYYGQAVNRCARLRAVAHGGQTILSSSTKRLAITLPDELALKDLGQHRLKDLLEPERIYQLNAPGLDADFPALASLSAAKNNLPVQLSTFIGRVEQLEKIKKLVYKNRLVTLLGAGGTGKTRLALQAGADVLEEFPDGVWFGSLIGIDDPGLVAQVIGESLPISLQGKEPLDAIVDQYKDARALLIVDNCEHVVRGVATTVNQLLRKCPQLVVLATSREPIKVSGESVYIVPTMDCDLRGKEPDVDAVARLEAVQLFRDRASKRLSDVDVLTTETAADIAAICKKLDGIPLALEQAAAGLSYMSPKEILERLETHFSMLELDEAGVEDRHRTIQATIDWTYSRLTDEEKELFAALSVFAGGWTRDAAEFVCPGGVIPPSRVLPVLEMLVMRSLVVSERLEGWKISRYRLLEPIREYAVSRRLASVDSILRARHFEWFCHVADQAREAGLETDDFRFLKMLTADHDNIRLGMRWALDQRNLTDHAVKLCLCMYRFWLDRGHIREGATWFRRAMESGDSLPEHLRADGLLHLGIFAWQEGKLEAAEQAIIASLNLYSALCDPNGIARAKGNLANIAFRKGDLESAAFQYAPVADFFRGCADFDRLAPTLENFGVVESQLGHLDRAQVILEEAVAIRRKQGIKARLAKSIDSLLGVYALQGRLTANINLFQEGVELAFASDDIFATENLLEIAAQLCIHADEFRLAAQALGAIDNAAERSGRHVEPRLVAFREELKIRVQSQLGYKEFSAAIRDGRAAGSRDMLTVVCGRISLRGDLKDSGA